MKKTFLSIIFISAVSAAFFVSCSKKEAKKEEPKEVTAYSYDSFAGEWGAAAEIARLFEEETGYRLNVINCGEAVSVLGRAVEEKYSVKADVIIGIDNNLASRARSEGILSPYIPTGSENISYRLFKELGGDNLLTPYDYAHFAVIYNKNSGIPAPESLEDLTKDIYKGKIALMDPRTSTVGLGFLSWTVSVYGDNAPDYWKRLAPSILSLTPGWSSGWGMFTKGEVPLVISYTTSPASIIEYDGKDYAQALVFEQGHVEQVEGIGILKNAPNRKGAELFVDFFISEKAQALLPLTQWMNPANRVADLPECYKKGAPVPEVTLETYSEKTMSLLEQSVEALAK